MPMPPPRPVTEKLPGRNVKREINQIVRALRSEGPQSEEQLVALVGARFWAEGHFARALEVAVAKQRVKKLPDDRYQSTSDAAPR